LLTTGGRAGTDENEHATVDKAAAFKHCRWFLRRTGLWSVTGKRMMLGQDITWKPDNIYSRIGMAEIQLEHDNHAKKDIARSIGVACRLKVHL
jgi:hypothetical protein